MDKYYEEAEAVIAQVKRVVKERMHAFRKQWQRFLPVGIF